MKKNNKYITIIGHSGYIDSLLKKKLSRNKNVKLIKSNYFYNNFKDLKKNDKKIILKSKLIYYLTFNNDLKFAQKNRKLHFQQTILPLKALLKLLEYKKEITNIIFTSTVTVYGNTKNKKINESYKPNPISVYDKHKIYCENLLLSFSKRSNIKTTIFRLSNVYGYSLIKSKSKNRGFINNITKSACAGNDMIVYGSGNYLRDFIHIKDVVDLLFIAKLKQANNKIYNLSYGKSYSLLYLLKFIKKLVNLKKNIDIKILNQKWPKNTMLIEKRNFKTSINKIKKDFFWSPNINLKNGLEQMVDD